MKTIRGDIFSSPAKVLAHGCNTFGHMGAGIAVQFRIRFPAMFRAYQQFCYTTDPSNIPSGMQYHDVRAETHDRSPLEGTCWLWRNPDPAGQDVACLFTQKGWPADMGLIEQALADLKRQMTDAGLTSVALPAIGCGVAKTKNVNLTKVTAVIEATFKDTKIEPILYVL